MRRLMPARGFTLLEVLIAVLIFTLGLLGVAGLMVLSVRTNHSAYLRTQASFLAQSMADRMRSNVGWANDYTGTYDSSTTGAGTCSGGVCTPAALVTRDTQLWSQQLVDQLPGGTATITCNGTYGEGALPRGSGTEPFDGICSMVIQWTEADLQRTATAAPPATQTFAWVFQP